MCVLEPTEQIHGWQSRNWGRSNVYMCIPGNLSPISSQPCPVTLYVVLYIGRQHIYRSITRVYNLRHRRGTFIHDDLQDCKYFYDRKSVSTFTWSPEPTGAFAASVGGSPLPVATQTLPCAERSTAQRTYNVRPGQYEFIAGFSIGGLYIVAVICYAHTPNSTRWTKNNKEQMTESNL